MPALAKIYESYKNQVAFFVVYILEAHATDAWQTSANMKDKVLIATPANLDARGEIAQSCVLHLKIPFPAVLDDFQNSTETAYTGWPDRLYVIGRDGRIAYKSKPGPYGFKPDEMATVLARMGLGVAPR